MWALLLRFFLLESVLQTFQEVSTETMNIHKFSILNIRINVKLILKNEKKSLMIKFSL